MDELMVGDEKFVAIQHCFDPIYSIRRLAAAMISLAINDVGKAKFRAGALRWINDTEADKITSFIGCCDLLGKDPGFLRGLVGRYEQSGKNIRSYNLKTGVKRRRLPGRKAHNQCRMPGCGRWAVDKYCFRCASLVNNRRFKYPYNPELWHLPIQPKGGRKTLFVVYEELRNGNR